MGSLTRKHSFWWENSAPDFTLQPQLPPYADIVIVGAGFAGISTAFWLLRLAKMHNKKGLRIIVLDEAPHAAFKATGRMNGSIYLGSNHTPKHMTDLLGKKTAAKLYRYSELNNTALQEWIQKGVDCDAEFSGGFRMASTAQEALDLDDSADLLNDWGFCSARFDHDQSGHVLTVPYTTGSLYIPGEGLFDPFAFTNKMARMLRKHNIWVVYGTRVMQTSTSPDYGPQLHLANGHVLSAGKIVHTTENTAPWSRIQESVVCRREQVVRTEPFSEDLDELPLPHMPIELSDGLDSIRMYDHAVIMTGGKAGLKKDPELNVTNDTGFNDRVLKQLDKTMMHGFPFTNHMEITHTWTYIEKEASDGLPLMGEIPDSGGHYVNIAHGRNKFGLAFQGAKNIAQRLLRVKMTNPEFNIFAPKRLTRGE